MHWGNTHGEVVTVFCTHSKKKRRHPSAIAPNSFYSCQHDATHRRLFDHAKTNYNTPAHPARTRRIMKRYWHDPHYKRMRKKLAVRSLLRKLRLKGLRRLDHQLEEGVSKPDRIFHNQWKHLPIPVRLVPAPAQMCFHKNPDGMVAFIDTLSECLARKQPVIVVMHGVQELSLNAITVLLAVMVQFRSSGIKFSGDMPEKPDVKELFLQSRFFDHLNAAVDHPSSNQRGPNSKWPHSDLMFANRRTYSFPGDSIFTHGKQKVDPEFGQELIEQASKTIWGETRRCTGVQRVLIELMHNTNNHAAGGGKKELWWISLQHLKAEKKVVFCFVDFGIGVFESLSQKSPDDFWFNASRLIKRLLRLTNYADALKLILTGKVHETVTKKYYRGKGLPGIYKALKDGSISNMHMITNKAYYSSRDNRFRNMAQSFSGTFISWELSSENRSLPR